MVGRKRRVGEQGVKWQLSGCTAVVLRRLTTRDALERCISDTWPAALQRCGRYLPWILIRSQCFRVGGPYILPCTPSVDGSRMALVALCRAPPRTRGGSAEAETCVRGSYTARIFSHESVMTLT